MAIIYVDNLKTTGANDGTSWANAFSNLQNGLNAAYNAGDEVWLRDNGVSHPYIGAYTVNRSNISIYGGFAGSETQTNQRNVITRPAKFIQAFSGVFQHTDPGVTYDGLLFDLAGAGSYVSYGGAIDSSNNAITVRNCIFLNCPASSGGGALALSSGSTVENCFFKNCSTAYSGGLGGAIYSTTPPLAPSTTIRNSVFVNNSSTAYGGAIYCEDNTLIKNCLFKNNSSNSGGGVWYNLKTSTNYGEMIVNNTFAQNIATNLAGGLYIEGSSYIGLTNNIFWMDTSYSIAYEIYSNSTVSLYNNTIYNTVVDPNIYIINYFSNIDVEVNTLNSDPLFVNPSSGDFNLQPGSPCIGSGRGVVDRGVISHLADFTGTPTSGIVPFTVSFREQSYASGIYRNTSQWDFGDGSTLLNTANPTHSYGVAGTYDVGFCGIVVGFCGVYYSPIYNSFYPSYTSSNIKSSYIVAASPPPPPVAVIFYSSPTIGEMPYTITFSDASTGGVVTSRSWSCTNGQTSSGTTFTPTLASNGFFTITLTVYGPGGSDHTSVYIGVRPIAIFNKSSGSIDEGQTVTFDASSSYVSISSYVWDFGDGFTQTAYTPITSHQYNVPGNYEVKLTVSYAGISSSTYYSSFVDVIALPSPPPGLPVVDFTFNPSTGYPSLTNFSLSGSAVYGGTIGQWDWDFGDSTPHSNSQSTSHSFSTNQNFNVTLYATHFCGSVTRTGSVTKVIPIKPRAYFTPISVVTITEGNSVSFDGTGSGVTINSWTWNFNDGPPQSGSNVSHIYSTAGTYSVTLTVVGPDGITDALTRTNLIVVNPPPPPPPAAPIADFYLNPSEGIIPLTVNFTDSCSGGPVTTRDWDFGDGSSHSSSTNPSHVYSVNKIYTVRLTATGPGGSSYRERVVSVKPKADFSVTPTTALIGDNVSFDGTSSAVNITDWNWNFGDSSSDTGSTTAKSYSAAGIYDITLSVIGTDGLSDSKQQTSLLTVYPKVVANFTFTPPTGKMPLVVTFTDTSTGGPTTWAWNFGNGDTATTQGPHIITYATNGVYTITLTVTGPGPSNTSTKTSTIYVKPKANFTFSPVTGPIPLTVFFTDASSTTITSWAWEFGDGVGTSTLQNPTYIYNDIDIYNVKLTVTGPGGTDTITLGTITSQFPGDTYYVDLNINTSGGIGTYDDPLNYTEFVNATDDTLPYRIRGARLLEASDPYVVNKFGFDLGAWDTKLYGPWRIKASDSSQTTYTFNVSNCSNLILETEFENTDSSVGLYLNVCGTVKTSHIRAKDNFHLSIVGNSSVLGSNIIAEPSSTNLNFCGVNSLTVDKSFVDIKDMTVDGTVSGSQFIVQDSVCNHGGMNRFGSSVAGIATYTNVQFGYDNPESWPVWDAGAWVSGGGLDPTLWAQWSVWGRRVTNGVTDFTAIPLGSFKEFRLGIGDFYFDASLEETVSTTKDAFIEVSDRSTKTCNKLTSVVWIKQPLVADGHVLYPLVISDVYGGVLDSDAALKLEIKKEGKDYRLQYFGSKSKLIYKTLGIDLSDGQWHFLGYVCYDDAGHMIYYVDGNELTSEDGLDEDGFEFSIARTKSSRVGGGEIQSPYLYESNTGINLYNLRLSVGISVHKEWIVELMNIDKSDLGI